MRWVAAALLALLVLAPVADGKRKPGKRVKVTKVRAKAPKAWRAAPGFDRPTVVLAPAAATPAPAAAPTQAPAAPAATATPDPVLPAPSTRSVNVVSTEWAFTLSQTTVDAGDVRVQFDNSRAEDPHQLVLVRDAERHDVGELGPGAVKRVTLPLRSGTYQLLCPLPEHEARGMRATLRVR